MNPETPEKRSVHTDALATLGTILIGDGNHRDAIHLAVEPVTAGEVLHPGQHVGFIKGLAYGKAEEKFGIVDPFLEGMIMEGEQFWMVVYPRKINSLRHVWEWDKFEAAKNDTKDYIFQSEQWLRDWCANNDVPPYEIVMAALNGSQLPEVDGYGNAYSNDGDGITFYGRNAHCAIPPEFLTHAEKVLGKKLSPSLEYFSCSC